MELDEPRYLDRDELLAVRTRGLAGARLAGLWAVGDLAGLRGRTVAVVGSRAPSEGARRRAHRLGAALARAGLCVISGLAHGMQGAF